MEYEVFKAKTVDEAITQACIAFGITSDQLEFDVTDEGSSGFLGIGARPAAIRARKHIEEIMKPVIPEEKPEVDGNKAEVVTEQEEEVVQPKIVTMDEIEKRAAAAARTKRAARAEESSDGEVREKKNRRDRERPARGEKRDRRDRRDRREKTREVAEEAIEIADYTPSQPKPRREVLPKTEEEVAIMQEKASTFLTDVFKAMGCDVNISFSYDQEEGCLSATFDGEDMGLLIGKRGQTLDSLQYLTSLVVNKDKSDYTRVKLDTEDYRARRADTLENLSRNIAFKVKRTRRPVSLEPMNPYERRIIHSTLQNNQFVETYSEGEEPYRHVVVVPKRK